MPQNRGTQAQFRSWPYSSFIWISEDSVRLGLETPIQNRHSIFIIFVKIFSNKFSCHKGPWLQQGQLYSLETFTFCKQFHFVNSFFTEDFSSLTTLLPDWSSIERANWRKKLKRNLALLQSVISCSKWPKSSRTICFSIMERIPTVNDNNNWQWWQLLVT